MAVRVQVPLAVQMEEVLNMEMLGTFFYFSLRHWVTLVTRIPANQWFVGVTRIKVA